MSSSYAVAAQVEIVQSEEAGAYSAAAAALRGALAPSVSTNLISASSVEKGKGESEASVVVALGSRALKAALTRRNTRIIAALVPRDSFQAALQEAPKQRDPKTVTAIFLDQPYARQLELIRAVVPDRRRVGVLYSPGQEGTLNLLHAAAKARNLEVVDASVASPQEIYSALSGLLPQTDLLLAIPDPAIFNGGTISNILLATFRSEIPVFGFSAAYVRAGALAAIYSSPEQVAQQVADIARRTLAGNVPPPPQYPQLFSVGVNDTVARSLHLKTPTATEIEAKLRAMESEQ